MTVGGNPQPASVCRPNHWGWVDIRPIDRPWQPPVGGWGPRLWGYENDCNRHFSTVAGCLNGPRAGRKERGKSGSFIPHSSQKGGEAFPSSVCNHCNKAGGSQVVSERRSASRCVVVCHSICAADAPIPPLPPVLPLFLLVPGWSRCVLPVSPSAAALQSERLRVLHQRRLRGLPQPSARSGCPSATSGSRTWARAALSSRPPSVVADSDVNVL